jgi:hypothetical protein
MKEKFLALMLVAILAACSGGGNGGAGGASTTTENNRQQTPAECQEKLKLKIIENGIERDATPAEIGVQGYEIAEKCGFKTEEELMEYLKLQGHE